MVKRILNKLFLKKAAWRYDYLIKQGNLIVGEHCDLSRLIIVHNKLITGKSNITIGDYCQIWGILVLHDENSIIKIGTRVFIGDQTTLNVKNEIEIGNDVLISWDCTLIDSNSHPLEFEHRKNDVVDWQKGPTNKDWSHVISKKIKISDKSWIGLKSIILKGVELGEGSIVGAGSVVTKNTEPYAMVAGNPAKKINKK